MSYTLLSLSSSVNSLLGFQVCCLHMLRWSLPFLVICIWSICAHWPRPPTIRRKPTWYDQRTSTHWFCTDSPLIVGPRPLLMHNAPQNRTARWVWCYSLVTSVNIWCAMSESSYFSMDQSFLLLYNVICESDRVVQRWESLCSVQPIERLNLSRLEFLLLCCCSLAARAIMWRAMSEKFESVRGKVLFAVFISSNWYSHHYRWIYLNCFWKRWTLQKKPASRWCTKNLRWRMSSLSIRWTSRRWKSAFRPFSNFATYCYGLQLVICPNIKSQDNVFYCVNRKKQLKCYLALAENVIVESNCICVHMVSCHLLCSFSFGYNSIGSVFEWYHFYDPALNYHFNPFLIQIFPRMN